MKGYYVFGVLLVLSILLTGCDSSGKEDEGSSESGFIGGTSGLVLRWLYPDNGYSLLDDGNSELSLELQIENLGEADVPGGKAVVSISGINPRDFNLQKGDLTKIIEDDIKGRYKLDKEEMDGGVAVVSYPPMKYLPEVSTDMDMPLIAEICYPYKTKAEAILCVSENPVNSNVCNPTGSRPVFSSGAPIQITNFKQQAYGENKFLITFTIKHAGNGEIFKSGEGCDSTEYSSRAVVNVKVGNKEEWGWNKINIDCNGNTAGQPFTQRLTYGDEATVRCKLDISDTYTGDYVRVLPIELEYDYRESVSTTLRITSTGLAEE